jgi:hypothetical protein
VLADFYAIVSDFYDRIMTQYGKKKIKGREIVRPASFRLCAVSAYAVCVRACACACARLCVYAVCVHAILTLVIWPNPLGQVFYPLLTGLLCAAHVKFFEAKYYEMLEMLLKSLKVSRSLLSLFARAGSLFSRRIAVSSGH